MTRRIAITGIGIVCSAGIGLEEVLKGNTDTFTVPTLDHFTSPDIGLPGYKTVPSHFTAKTYVQRRKDLKLMSRANRLAVAAAVLAVQDAGLEDTDLTSAGLCVGVGQEPAELKDILPAAQRSHINGTFDLDRFVVEGMRYMNPLSSLKTLPNMSLAHVGIRLGIRGPGWTLCTDERAGIDAIGEAIQLMRDGRASTVLSALPMRKRVSQTGSHLGVTKSKALPPGSSILCVRVRGPRAGRWTKPIHNFPTRLAPPFIFRANLWTLGAATLALGYALSLGRSGRNQSAIGSNERQGNMQPPALHIHRKRSPVAITAVGFCTPLGNELEQFSALLTGRSPSNRLLRSMHQISQ